MVADNILVVDDDPNIRAIICFALEKAGMTVAVARDGAEALAGFESNPCDLIVLDIGMPEMDGLEVCRRIRKTSNVPILFLSARDDEIDRVIGLEIGGDDYVTKPFSARELVARIKVILKRARSHPNSAPEGDWHQRHGGLALDREGHRVTVADTEVALTAIEFTILAMLVARPRQVFSRGRILDGVYGGAITVSDRTVDSHVRNIRAKLTAAGCSDAVETVHGVGFRLGSCTVSR